MSVVEYNKLSSVRREVTKTSYFHFSVCRLQATHGYIRWRF